MERVRRRSRIPTATERLQGCVVDAGFRQRCRGGGGRHLAGDGPLHERPARRHVEKTGWVGVLQERWPGGRDWFQGPGRGVMLGEPDRAPPDGARPTIETTPDRIHEEATIPTLRETLSSLDGKPYGAYRGVKGSWTLPAFELEIRHVQSDPFAPPSRCAAFLTPESASLPPRALATAAGRVATACFMARRFQDEARARSRAGQGGSGKSGTVSMLDLEQLVLTNTGVSVTAEGAVEARFGVGLPARGRRIQGRQAASLLTEVLPDVVAAALRGPGLDEEALLRAVEVNEDADALREQLADHGLVAFLAEGAHLPRRTGVDPRPLEGEAVVPLTVPPSLAVTLHRPNAGPVRGIGVPEGVTLLVGGGYHGKSTVLEAVRRGVYNHVPGDGREAVVTDPSAVKVQAEDGRAVTGVDISPFIGRLPGGVETERFSTPNASGSTSQAAAIMEAVEAGSRLLLIDEDTSATNFMIRDRRMQALVPREREPITPLVDRIRDLHRDLGVSTVLVVGGSGDYLDVADTVIGMLDYRPEDLTSRARQVARELPTGRTADEREDPPRPRRRFLDPRCLDPARDSRRARARARGADTIELGGERIDVGAVAGLVLAGQTQAVARALAYLSRQGTHQEVRALLDGLMEGVEQEGLDVLDPRLSGELALFRPMDAAAALNRMRGLRLSPESTDTEA